MEAKHSTAEAAHATTEAAHTEEDHAAAAEAANVAAEGDAASASKANGKGGKLANGRVATCPEGVVCADTPSPPRTPVFY